MEQHWTLWTITDKTPPHGPLTTDNFEEYILEVKEGNGINLILVTGGRPVPYPNLRSGDTRRSEIGLLLRGLSYTVSRTPGHTEPFKVVVSVR
jgi:hypothetical protein